MSIGRVFPVSVAFCLLTACTASTVEQASEVLQSKAMAVSMSDEWVRQRLIDTPLSFEYPVPLSMNHVAAGAGNALFTALMNGDHTMYALSLPYERAADERHLPFLRMAVRDKLMATGSCDALKESSHTLSLDFTRTNICTVHQGPRGPVAYAVGFLAGTDVDEFNAMMLFMGPREAILMEQVFALKDLSPEAQQMIDDYFRKHPTMTQLWWDVPSVQTLMRKLKPVYTKAVQQPSPAVKTAMDFMRRIAESAEWK